MVSSFVTNATLAAAASIMVMLLIFSSWKAFAGTANLLHWRFSAGLFYIGVLCFIAKVFTSSYMEAAGAFHERFFFLIPVGFLFLFLGSAAAVARLVLSDVKLSRRATRPAVRRSALPARDSAR